MEKLIKYSKFDYTYFAIGCAAHDIKVEAKNFQMFPHFIHKLYSSGKSVRLILMDPELFKTPSISILIDYLSDHKIDVKGDPFSILKGNKIEIILMNNESNPKILENIVDIFMSKSENERLIVQSYMGNSLIKEHKMFYKKSKNKDKYLKNILLDFSYGIDTDRCSLDLFKFQPIIDHNGHFVNAYLLEYDQLKPYKKYFDKIEPCIREKLKTELDKIINECIKKDPHEINHKLCQANDKIIKFIKLFNPKNLSLFKTDCIKKPDELFELNNWKHYIYSTLDLYKKESS